VGGKLPYDYVQLCQLGESAVIVLYFIEAFHNTAFWYIRYKKLLLF
jgi:hypothetical protein